MPRREPCFPVHQLVSRMWWGAFERLPDAAKRSCLGRFPPAGRAQREQYLRSLGVHGAPGAPPAHAPPPPRPAAANSARGPRKDELGRAATTTIAAHAPSNGSFRHAPPSASAVAANVDSSRHVRAGAASSADAASAGALIISPRRVRVAVTSPVYTATESAHGAYSTRAEAAERNARGGSARKRHAHMHQMQRRNTLSSGMKLSSARPRKTKKASP
uniref:Uncharacterized protein n=1 Tax=Calcidiscus leptoporus TaxID=127549 RepID=A0A7S0NYK0_9EUKA